MLALSAGLGAMGVLGPVASALGSRSREATVKAALMFNFGRFIAWPAGVFESDDTPIIVGFYRETEIATALAAGTKGKLANGRALRLVQLNTPADAARCQMAYAGESETDMAGVTADKPVVSVSADGNFLGAGGLIRLYTEGGKVKFNINQPQAGKVGLAVSPKLLKLAS
ncbi:MAG: YfiR family protein [Planctomycetota bacterium]